MAHLLGVLASQPDSPALGENELVTTGTLTAALPVKAGESWSTTLDGIALSGLTIDFISGPG
jgi:2-oxo-3-hexenedioate decarboxylase